MAENTPNLDLYKKNPATDGDDTFNIDTMLNDNWDKIDAAAGSQTITDAQAPTGDTGTPTTLLGWLANMIKSITGKSSWRTAPSTTLEAAKTHADDTTRHITAAERTDWNAKASTDLATTTTPGLMAAADKSKLDGVAAGANNYTHPATHPPTIIVQDVYNRFVTDGDKANWNAKASTAWATASTSGLMPAADKAKLDAVTGIWGDNTLTSRPAFMARRYVSQTLNSSFNKLIFETVKYDNTGDYTPSLGRFTVPTTGIYLITTEVTFNLNHSTGTSQLALYLSGNLYNLLDMGINSGTSSIYCYLTGSIATQLVAGEYIEIYLKPPAAMTLTASANEFLSIVRIA